MSINAVRMVGYLDDGVSKYECLNCYNRWDSRTGVFVDFGDRTPRDIHHSKLIWKFCPYCGTEWDGFLPNSHEEDTYVYQPRARSYKVWVIEKRYPGLQDHGQPFEEMWDSPRTGMRVAAQPLTALKAEVAKYERDRGTGAQVDCRLAYVRTSNPYTMRDYEVIGYFPRDRGPYEP